MTDYNFSKKYVDENGIISYEQIKLDNEVKRYQYLPYLNYLDVDLVDNYNKFILKRRFGYYEDQNNPNNFKDGSLINNSKIIENLINEYSNLVNFSYKLNNNFNDAIYKSDYYDRDIYFTYKSICETNLYFEINRLYSVILRFQKYNYKIKSKKFTITHLFFIMFILYFVFLLFYNRFN